MKRPKIRSWTSDRSARRAYPGIPLHRSLRRSIGLVAFEGVGGDAPGHVSLVDRCAGGASWLAPRLVLEAGQHFRAESQPGIAGEHLRPRVRRELLRAASDYLPAGGDL